MKKFAEDDRLEQVSEHKRRMKVTAVKTVKGVIRGTRMTKGFEMFFFGEKNDVALTFNQDDCICNCKNQSSKISNLNLQQRIYQNLASFSGRTAQARG